MSRRRRNDPQSRKARGYDVEIPSRAELLAFISEQAGPCELDELLEGFRVSDEAVADGISNRLRAMVRDGELVLTREERLGVPREMNLIPGTVIAHPDGYAFVRPDEDGEDLFIPARVARMALHGDRVAVRLAGVDERGRREGSIVKVLERANSEIVGRFHKEGGIGFVTPDNRRINQDVLIPPGKSGKAKVGDFVKVRITDQPDKRHQPIGEVIERIGSPTTPGMATDIAIASHDIPTEWPQAVLDEVAAVPERVPQAAKRHRRDLRSLPFVTIDGEDARDFDDAIYVERDDDGWLLYVAIADVSHYVRPGSALDEEALLRGNSVYFPDRVIPMLPEKLSNGLCSLNPNVDRLAMVAEMHLGPRGALRDSTFYPAVIRSHARLTYNQVQQFLDEGTDDVVRPDLQMPIQDAYRLYRLLLARREQRGALEIDSVETYVVLDEAEQIEAILPRARLEAHRLIEEFMVLANVAAAQFVTAAEKPALFRVHGQPEEERVLDLKLLLSSLKLSLGGGDAPKPRDFARVLQEARALPEAHLIQTAVLRTMMMAVYSPKNDGHFGLALRAYAHFTSPIRRYPDLLLHRAIRAALGEQDHLDPETGFEEMKRLGEACSATERRADEATRDAMQRMKCEYMADRVGEVYNGRINGVTAFGLFVELDDMYVEGLVHITSLPRDYYEYKQGLHELEGRRSRRVFRLGDAVRVQVARVDVDDRKIDFLLDQDSPAVYAAPGAGGDAAGSGAPKDADRQRAGKGASKRGASDESGGKSGGKRRSRSGRRRR